MCTSFLCRGDDILIGMNYDNHGKNLKLANYRDDLFLVTIHSFGKDRPLFGVRSDGVFVNQQVVNECEQGRYQVGFRHVHTAKLLNEVLMKRYPMHRFSSYLEKHTIVSPPKNSLHTLVACCKGDSWIIEPGRGSIWYSEEEPYFVMSNCPIWDRRQTGRLEGYGVDRQLKAENMLKNASCSFGIEDAFKVLEAVHQTTEEWETEFSLVYSYNQNKVYYCYDHNFNNIKEYQLKKERREKR